MTPVSGLNSSACTHYYCVIVVGPDHSFGTAVYDPGNVTRQSGPSVVPFETPLWAQANGPHSHSVPNPHYGASKVNTRALRTPFRLLLGVVMDLCTPLLVYIPITSLGLGPDPIE